MESAGGRTKSGIRAPLDRAKGTGIRNLRSMNDLRACVALQREVWGPEFDDVVPPSLLRVSTEMGGVVAGAVGVEGSLLGFVYGLTGIRGGRTSHWSHMLGVRKEHRRAGIGLALKLFQRERVLAAGVREMRWTFDPLVAGNAYFNLTRLGARVEEYIPDMYGDTGSRIHRSGTDRFLVRWDLDEPVGSPADPRAATIDWETAPVVNRNPAQGAMRQAGIPWDPALRIRIPRNVLRSDGGDPDLALAWRRSTRDAFLEVLARGYTTAGFSHQDEGPCCHYLLLAPSG